MSRRFPIIVALSLATFVLTAAQPALADSESATYQIHLEGPQVASAANGDTADITIDGHGELTTSPKSAEGHGHLTHKNSAGNVLGTATWTITGLLSFKSYGHLPPPDDNLFGGQAVLRVTVTPDAGGGPFDGVMWVTCLIGKAPAGAQEGARLQINGVINFNKEVSGGNVFVLE
jgi:hypothetical protein